MDFLNKKLEKYFFRVWSEPFFGEGEKWAILVQIWVQSVFLDGSKMIIFLKLGLSRRSRFFEKIDFFQKDIFDQVLAGPGKKALTSRFFQGRLKKMDQI